MKYSALSRALFNLFAWTIVVVVSFPLIWTIVTSLKPQTELFRIPPSLLPGTVTFEHYEKLLIGTKFLTYFGNSVIVSVATTALVIVVGVLGAHSLVRFSYPGRERLAQLVLFTYLLPSVVLIIPLYLMLVSLGLANTLFSLTIAYTTFALPFALWLLRSFMAGIPQDLEAAAMVDGASRMGAFFDVILPQALPGIISTAVFTFILAWNEYLFALVLVNQELLAHADHRRHHHAGDVVPHRMVDADGRLGDDERAGDRGLRLPAEAPDPRLRRGRRKRLSASWPR